MHKELPKTYNIRTVEDIIEIPEDRLEDFLVDLRAYLNIIKTKYNGGYIKFLCFKIPIKRCGFQWIDDGKHDFLGISIVPF